MNRAYPNRSGDMLTHANRIRHGGKRWVHRTDADEEAGVDHIQIVEFMSFAVDIENRACRVLAEAAGARLVSHAGDGDFRFEIGIAWNQMVRMHAQMLQHGFQLVVELLFRRLVVRCVSLE